MRPPLILKLPAELSCRPSVHSLFLLRLIVQSILHRFFRHKLFGEIAVLASNGIHNTVSENLVYCPRAEEYDVGSKECSTSEAAEGIFFSRHSLLSSLLLWSCSSKVRLAFETVDHSTDAFLLRCCFADSAPFTFSDEFVALAAVSVRFPSIE